MGGDPRDRGEGLFCRSPMSRRARSMTVTAVVLQRPHVLEIPGTRILLRAPASDAPRIER